MVKFDVTNTKRWIEYEDFVGGLVDDLKPRMILDVDIGFSVPFLKRVTIFVQLSSSHEKRTGSEKNLPSKYFPKRQ